MMQIQKTAKIYQFPSRDRLAANVSRNETKSSKADLRIDPAPRVVFDGWYHDAAIIESRGPGKR